MLTFIRPDQISTVFFTAIVLFVAASLVIAVHRSARASGVLSWRPTVRAGAGVLLWFCLVSGVVQSGELVAQPYPRLMIFFLALNLTGLLFGLSRTGGQISRTLPFGLLIAFQGFRLPLELILHDWAMQGVIPHTMTWSGSNFDIVSGGVALLAAPFADRRPWLAWTANLIGFALLLNVMRVAILSSPLPFGWAVQPPLQLAFHLPYAWIIACVAGALAGHVILTRALLRR